MRAGDGCSMGLVQSATHLTVASAPRRTSKIEVRAVGEKNAISAYVAQADDCPRQDDHTAVSARRWLRESLVVVSRKKDSEVGEEWRCCSRSTVHSGSRYMDGNLSLRCKYTLRYRKLQ